MDVKEENKVIRKMNKYIKFCESIRKKLVQLAQKTDPKYYDIEKIDKIMSNLTCDSLSIEIAKYYLEELAKNLISKLQRRKFEFPLSTENANTIELLINFKIFVSQNKEKFRIAEKEDLLNNQNINKLKKLLDDSYKVKSYYKLRNKTKSPSSNISSHITEQEHYFLYLFDKIVIHSKHSTSTERNELSLMLEYSIGNMGFNKRLNRLIKEKKHSILKYTYAIS